MGEGDAEEEGQGKRWIKRHNTESVRTERTEEGCTSNRRTGTYARIEHARAPGLFLGSSLVSRLKSSLAPAAAHVSSSLFTPVCLLFLLVPVR